MYRNYEVMIIIRNVLGRMVNQWLSFVTLYTYALGIQTLVLFVVLFQPNWGFVTPINPEIGSYAIDSRTRMQKPILPKNHLSKPTTNVYAHLYFCYIFKISTRFLFFPFFLFLHHESIDFSFLFFHRITFPLSAIY